MLDGVTGISAHAGRTPDKPAFVLDGHVLTYREFDDRSTLAAHALGTMGVDAGDRIAIMLPNCFEFFEVWAAAAKLGALVVLVNYHLKRDELAYILEDSGAKVLVAHTALGEEVRAAPECALLLVGADDGYEQALAAISADASALDTETLASPVFYTSGTTGRPKGVVHESMADAQRARQQTLGQVALWGWNEHDVYILSGPAYHAGPGGFAIAALFVGATVVILPTWDATEWLRLVDEHGVTISFMVPAHFIRILEVPDEVRARRDLSSLRMIVHAGAPCPVAVKRRIFDALAAAQIWELYGASEGGATRISPQEWLEHPGSVGVPWPGIEVRILDEDGEPCLPGVPGLVYIAPAGARFHYHDDPDKTEGAWRDNAFTVGDVGYLDDDGYLYLTDRATDLVIRGGVNIYPREIEEVLYTHPAVVDCAVFGVPDERFGEQLKAVVEVRAAVEADELRAFCAQHLADFKVPAIFELVDELPRQPNGKVLKRLLREQHWADQGKKIG